MYDSRKASLALRAIRVANVRFGILPPQSCIRLDDDELIFAGLASSHDYSGHRCGAMRMRSQRGNA